MADENDGSSVELADPGHDCAIVRPSAIPVELEEIVEDALDVIQRVRTILVPSELDGAPDLLGARLTLQMLELILQPLELAAQLRPSQELHAGELTKPLAQPDLGFARHSAHCSARNRRRSRPRVGRSSSRGTIASMWPKR